MEMTTTKTKLLAFPMHGGHKLIREGFRTRDGHILEWAAKIVGNDGLIDVRSRPEPAIFAARDARRPKLSSRYSNLHEKNSYSLALPSFSDRQRWWVQSKDSYQTIRSVPANTPAIIWNPFVAVSNISQDLFNGRRSTVFDMLDDWTQHFAFQRVHADVEAAYAAMFANATHVTANAEGTEELAKRFGRDDVLRILNGVDPDRFDLPSTASGPLTVGYVGKIGRRLDLQLIQHVASAMPDVRFVIAGPILDAEYKTGLRGIPNLELPGDVHYDKMPELLQSFDVGWVPHRVGEGEVGGDVIKTYEYRAAGLPVLSTPVTGAGARGLGHVVVLDATEHLGYLRKLAQSGLRQPRRSESIGRELHWDYKASTMLDLLSVAGPND